MQVDLRLVSAPKLVKGTKPGPLDCRGIGNHDELGYVCANHPLKGCYGWVCQRCAAKQKTKQYCETCAVCLLAETNGGSISRALSKLAELHPESVKRGKVGCASTAPNLKPCRKCVRHTCKQCARDFRAHHNKTAYCGDICRRTAIRESNRQSQERHREKAVAA